MKKTKIDDGYSSYLVEGATFVGRFQIPQLIFQKVPIPKVLIPFDKRKKHDGKNQAIDFYMHDRFFNQIITHANRYLEDLRKFESIITPDCSLYRDMPLCLQITNTYFNRAVGHFLQRNGFTVIPNVRWGDERSFGFCFDGIPHNSMVAVSTHGCIHSNEDKYYFRLGLETMIKTLHPSIVLVHGQMPANVFISTSAETEYIHYDSYIKLVKEGE